MSEPFCQYHEEEVSKEKMEGKCLNVNNGKKCKHLRRHIQKQKFVNRTGKAKGRIPKF